MSDFLLHAPEGANKKPKRVGRGSSSGLGTTAGKGNKGQQSRSGSAVPYVGFEGGQMPLYRRIAHRGFSNYPFKKEYDVINVEVLEQKFAAGETVDKASLLSKGLIRSAKSLVKVLGNGDLTKNLTVDVDKVSASAKAKIEKAGGSVKSAEEAK
ncbi:50S ribosomal protein L15 [Treponema ruminis]|uniref:Large ribosomal subunit protein uL15 n=1 Tax=Treponema ruminis TaxID=744515 RepID=A0A7W8GAV3_9SPIR|nr:50S ribosomal protein L15 [Treponema ruminis]MBB5227038.1 large subunit ribosomal protein L15 [Treponema ruminis]QSI01465.1 50S ribosomal protein L15 [Treponema ruminis]